MFQKLRKSNSQTTEQSSPLQKQHALFSSLKSHRKNQTAPAALSISEMKEKEKAEKAEKAVKKKGSKEPTSPEEKPEKEGLKTGQNCKGADKDSQSSSPSIRKKFFDGLFHTFRPSKSRDTSPLGSKESLSKSKEDKNKVSPMSSHPELPGAEDHKRNSNKSPVKRTQSARDANDTHLNVKGSAGLSCDGAPGNNAASSQQDSSSAARSQRASTGSLQKDSELTPSSAKTSTNRNASVGSSSPNKGKVESSGVTQNRLSYTSVSSTEADDAFVSCPSQQ